ncbi:pyridoxamine 5'-phosphate oxidase [Leptospira sp. 96542]|nr:pyridoxamine 5'-phosphate oxidase [Leptospira sp. 96542]
MEAPNDLSSMRKSYSRSELSETTVGSDPILFFNSWFQEAIEAKEEEPNATILSTAGEDGQPSARVVLLKGVESEGFVFFTNYESKKGKQLAMNPKAALTFFWAKTERQIRIQGIVEKISKEESEIYFGSRPRESQLGAIASNQSAILNSREEIESKMKNLTKLWEGQNIPKPENWGGYVLKPNLIEFWQGRVGRLHDRIQFELKNGIWKKQRLSP